MESTLNIDTEFLRCNTIGRYFGKFIPFQDGGLKERIFYRFNESSLEREILPEFDQAQEQPETRYTKGSES
ncbi:hypothetical protein WN55_10159 [Dufourea novaeangliae]|uniref:Uncharacterized protein n=1 Tax=Dufourea novaeangliae TaxID=178035 RepID=A0A154P545_DUFNO|nr:hypothetical protein WN55_10159 [Dufourea novaeangliae]